MDWRDNVPDLTKVQFGDMLSFQWGEKLAQKLPPTKDTSLPPNPDLNDATKAQSDPPSSHDGREKYRSAVSQLGRGMTDTYADELYSPTFHAASAPSTLTPTPSSETRAHHHRESSLSSLGSAGPASPYTASNSQLTVDPFQPFFDYHASSKPSVHISPEEDSLMPQYLNPWSTSIHDSLPAVTPAPTLDLYSKIYPQNDVFAQRLQAANNQHLSPLTNHNRLASPARERSPFRQGSPLAPTGNSFGPQSPNAQFGTAAHMREQQKAENDAKELQKQLERTSPGQTTPKTISPKDVDLIYHESEECVNTPLFLEKFVTIDSSERPLKYNLLSYAWGRTFIGRTFSKATHFKRKALEVVLNGVLCLARPDSGSDRNIMTEACAKEYGVSIMRGENDKGLFKLGTGKYISSIGRAYVPLSLLGDVQSKEYCWFDILAKCPVPVIIGLEFIRKIQLYTKNKHLLVESPFNFSMPTLKWIGSPKGRIEFMADGKTLTGGADTGSDLDFMSLGCARRRGFNIDRRESARTRVMLPDQTIVETIGQVHVSSLVISDFESFEMTFHVLPGLSCDVIFGEEFLEQMDAFNACDILDGEEDPSIYSLHTLINLGPIQSFLARKCLAKTLTAEEDSLLLEHDAGIEGEIYRRNKANRSISKIKNRARAEAAREDEEAKRRLFDRGHENCVHCSVEEDPRSESISN